MRLQLASFALLATLVLLVAGSGRADQLHEPIMRVYFIPFGASTYVHVTARDIEDSSAYAIWFVMPSSTLGTRTHPFVQKIEGILEQRPAQAQLNDGFIRLKVQLMDATFLVDNKGAVMAVPTGRTFRLSEADMKEVETDIVRFSGAIDIRAMRGLPKAFIPRID